MVNLKVTNPIFIFQVHAILVQFACNRNVCRAVSRECYRASLVGVDAVYACRKIYRLLKLSRDGVWRYHGYFALWNDAVSPRGGIGAIGDGDGPLRDTFTNRDINTKRSFIFFYASLSQPRRRSRILTRPSWRTPRENSLRPLPSPSLSPCSRSRTLLRVHARISAHDLRRGAAACSAAKNFMTISCSLHIRDSLQYAPPSN